MEQGRNNASNQRGYQQQYGYNHLQRPNMQSNSYQNNNYYQQNDYDRQINPYQPNSYYNTNNYNNEKRTSNTLALVSMIIGILSIVGSCCFGGFLGIVGITIGFVAFIDKYCNRKIMAFVGMLLSIIALAVSIFVLIIFMGDIEQSTVEETSIEESVAEEYDIEINEIQEVEDHVKEDNTEHSDSSYNDLDEITGYENPYEFTIEFTSGNKFDYICNSDADIQVYTYKAYDIFSGTHTNYCYARIPNGEYEIEYIGGDDYLMDQVGQLCTDKFIGYSQMDGSKIVDNTGYTIDDVPAETAEVWYEVEDYTVINRTTEGEGRITISNGDTLLIEDNTKQILAVFFDNHGEGLIKLNKLK